MRRRWHIDGYPDNVLLVSYEPYNRLVGLHKGDMVEVAPNHTREGVEFPMAVLDWMR